MVKKVSSSAFFIIFTFIFSFSLFSQSPQNTLTITTYYPSPFGVYKELRVKRMAIGDNYYDPSQHCWPGGSCSSPDIDNAADLVVEGNVGIGTTSPSDKLHVIGNVFIPSGSSYWIGNNADSGDRLRMHQTGTNAYIDYATGNLYFRAGTSVKVTLTSNGNVGIGTETPTQKLDVIGDTIISGKLGTAGRSPSCPNGWACGVHTYDIYADGAIHADKWIETDDAICIRGDCRTSWPGRIDFTIRTSTGGSTATCYCPLGYTRIACSGSREINLQDTCKEDDCGYIGTLPYGSNGCKTAIDSSSGTEAVAVCYCMKVY